MQNFYKFFLLSSVSVIIPLIGLTAPAAAAPNYFYLSTTTIEALNRDVSGMEPAIRTARVSGSWSASVLLRPFSCLGYFSPIGAYGVLSSISPLGPHYPPGAELFKELLESYAEIASAVPAFRMSLELAKQMASTTDLSSFAGFNPLGEEGPLNPKTWDSFLSTLATAEALGLIGDDFVQHLQPGGLWAILGPVGPTGPLGPLGALGPLASKGWKRESPLQANDYGDWLANEKLNCLPNEEDPGICRKVTVSWNATTKREYPLVEHYSEERAQSISNNDTSFLVDGEIESEGDTDEYQFQSEELQYVSILVLPHSGALFFDDAMRALFTSVFPSDPENFLEIPKSVPLVMGAAAIPSWTSYSYDHESAFDNFDLHLTLDIPRVGRREVTSNSSISPDWIQLRLPKGTRIRAEVSLTSKWEPSIQTIYRGVSARCFPGSVVCVPKYRLVVTGSGKNLSAVRVSGPHQIPL